MGSVATGQRSRRPVVHRHATVNGRNCENVVAHKLYNYVDAFALGGVPVGWHWINAMIIKINRHPMPFIDGFDEVQDATVGVNRDPGLVSHVEVARAS